MSFKKSAWIWGQLIFLLASCSHGQVEGPALPLPVAFLDANLRTSPKVPVDITLDASRSYSTEGPIVKYEWDFEGDGQFDLATTTPTTTSSFSAKGETVPQVRVTNARGGTATVALSGAPITLAKGWSIRTVQSGITMDTQTSCAIQTVGANKIYMIAYTVGPSRDANKDVLLARSKPNDPLHWSALPVNVTPNTPGPVFYPALLMVNGHPAIAYIQGIQGDDLDENKGLRYLRSLDTVGNTWGNTVTVHPFGLSNPSMAMVGSNPALAWVELRQTVPFTNRLRYARSSDSRGDAWPSRVTLFTSNFVVGCSLQMVGDSASSERPAVAFLESTTGNNYRYIRSLDITGAAWPADSSIIAHNVASIFSDASLRVVPGGKATVFSGSGTDGGLVFSLSGSADANTWGDQSPILRMPPTRTRNVVLRVFKGKPIVCAYDPDAQDLFVQKATDASGGSWGPVERVATLGDSGRFCSMEVAADLNLIFISFFGRNPLETTASSLMVAIWN